MNKTHTIKHLRLNKIENYTFFDVDDNIDSFIKHLTENHSSFFYKRSSSGNIHAIILNPCKDCDAYADKIYDGNLLFLNKGDKYSPLNWIGADKKLYDFEYKTIIHFLLQDYKSGFDSIKHIYYIGDITKEIEEKIIDMFHLNDTASIHITLHKALCKEWTKSYETYFVSSSGADFPFKNYMEIMDAKMVDDIKDVKKYVNRFEIKNNHI